VLYFQWTAEIIEHLAEHDVSSDDFEHVVQNPYALGSSRSSGLPCCWGDTLDGRSIICVFEEIDDMTILPVTAYEVPRPGRGRGRR
jgi:hypothetical protein